MRDEGTRKPAFARLASVDLSQVVEFCDVDSAQLSDLMKQQLDQPFDTTAALPLWRLKVLVDCTVVFVFHHAIGDGQSGIAFHLTLLNALNTVGAQEAPIIIPVPVSLAPTVEDATDVSVPFTTFCHKMYDIFAPASWSPRLSAWSGHPVASIIHKNTNVRMFSLPPDTAAAFLQQCKAHRATLTSIFHTLAVSVLSGLIEADPALAQNVRTISTNVPISLRQFTGMPPDAMCDHVSGYSSCVPLTKDKDAAAELWAAAAAFATTLRDNVARSRHQIGLLKYLFGNFQGYWEGQLGRKREVGLELSNTGRFPAAQTPIAEPDGGEGKMIRWGWEIENVYFAQGNPVCGAALKLNITGTPAGGIGVTVTWGNGAVDDAFADAFVDGFKACFGRVTPDAGSGTPEPSNSSQDSE